VSALKQGFGPAFFFGVGVVAAQWRACLSKKLLNIDAHLMVAKIGVLLLRRNEVIPKRQPIRRAKAQ